MSHTHLMLLRNRVKDRLDTSLKNIYGFTAQEAGYTNGWEAGLEAVLDTIDDIIVELQQMGPPNDGTKSSLANKDQATAKVDAAWRAADVAREAAMKATDLAKELEEE